MRTLTIASVSLCEWPRLEIMRFAVSRASSIATSTILNLNAEGSFTLLTGVGGRSGVVNLSICHVIWKLSQACCGLKVVGEFRGSREEFRNTEMDHSMQPDWCAPSQPKLPANRQSHGLGSRAALCVYPPREFGRPSVKERARTR